MVSPDVEDLASWVPPDELFSVFVQLLIGPIDGPGEESFGILFCSPMWLANEVAERGIVDGRHTYFVDSWDWRMICDYLNKRIASLEADSWTELAGQLSRIGHWEFEDYVGVRAPNRVFPPPKWWLPKWEAGKSV